MYKTLACTVENVNDRRRPRKTAYKRLNIGLLDRRTKQWKVDLDGQVYLGVLHESQKISNLFYYTRKEDSIYNLRYKIEDRRKKN
jgi:hypothetical protein